MKKTLQTLLFTITLTLSAGAMASQSVTVHVNGLVCDFCATAIEKVFGKQDAVEGVQVDLNEKIVSIDIKDDHQMSDEEITKLVMDSGYNVESIERVERQE
tara:strand:- start:523 stop:825 length:303 start_codon:yes stop_codon:yes gene_type:complete